MDIGDSIIVLEAPPIDGLVFRHFRGEADVQDVAAMRQEVASWDNTDPLSPRESIPTFNDIVEAYIIAPRLDTARDLLIAEVNGTLIGYNEIKTWTEEGNIHVYLHLGWLLPAWRGKGIGTAMLRWAQARCREMAHEQGEHGTGVYATNASSTEREATTLIVNDGYTRVRTLVEMELPSFAKLPAAPLPPDVDVRPVLPEHYRPIYEAYKDAWTGLWGTTARNEEDYQEFLDEKMRPRWFDPTLWQVAWSGESVVGMVLGEINKGIGIVAEVNVIPVWRKRGVGRALLVGCLRTFATKGLSRARLYTNAENHQGARSLYESVGFRELKTHGLYRKPIIGAS